MKLEELRVYNMADALSDNIWSMVTAWDFFAKDTIGKQLVRSADSISANIAEGYGRYFFKEKNVYDSFYRRFSSRAFFNSA